MRNPKLNNYATGVVADLAQYFTNNEVLRAKRRRAFFLNAARLKQAIENDPDITAQDLAVALGYSKKSFAAMFSSYAFGNLDLNFGALRAAMNQMDLAEDPPIPQKPVSRSTQRKRARGNHA